ncbi:MAG: SGNH/GDSL hydrolase family protein [Cyclobacteriaceae bacterium]
MEKLTGFLASLLLFPLFLPAQTTTAADTATYLADIKDELMTVWPDSRTINLVFHGHSVPAGYWHNHEVHTLESYPNIVLRKLKAQYPYAVINVIVTAIGGENSVKGQERFTRDVLSHRPDILFIDYALNDRSVGLEQAREAWEKMIQAALEQNIKIILLTPSPDQRLDILEPENPLALHADQIKELARQYHTGLADPFTQFQQIAASDEALSDYMSHVNHPNEKGHEIIVEEIIKWLKPLSKTK